MSTQNDKTVMGMVDLLECSPVVYNYAKILNDKIQRLEKDNNMLNWYLCDTGQWGDTDDDRVDQYCNENSKYATMWYKENGAIIEEIEPPPAVICATVPRKKEPDANTYDCYADYMAFCENEWAESQGRLLV